MKSSKLKFTNSAGVFTLDLQIEGPEFALPSNLSANLKGNQVTFDMQPESSETGTTCMFSQEGLKKLLKYNYQVENAPNLIQGVIGSAHDIVGTNCKMDLEELEIKNAAPGGRVTKKRVGIKLRKNSIGAPKKISSASVKNVNYKGNIWLGVIFQLEESEDPSTSFSFDANLDFRSLPGGDSVLIALKDVGSSFEFDEVIGNILVIES